MSYSSDARGTAKTTIIMDYLEGLSDDTARKLTIGGFFFVENVVDGRPEEFGSERGQKNR